MSLIFGGELKEKGSLLNYLPSREELNKKVPLK